MSRAQHQPPEAAPPKPAADPAKRRVEDPSTTADAPPTGGSLPVAFRRLSDLRSGERGRLYSARLPGDDAALLDALGLSEKSPFRLCKAGNPCIVQVGGTRIGISPEVARRLEVIDEPLR
ncbi:MAG: ferrous iron transport protein A [Holophagales bacterium]|nr:ferrous iron transport protein A [Holophagales bacterium]